MKTEIPMGLQALLKASAVLQQTSSPTAPGPQGQQPTVASQVAQQAEQMIPAMPEVKQQAGIANALKMQQMSERQQAAQNPEAIAQMAANLMRQGAGSLPVNMQFKSGGIIGFQAGGEPENPREKRERYAREFRERIARGLERMGSVFEPEAPVQYAEAIPQREIPSETGAQLGPVQRVSPEPEATPEPTETVKPDLAEGIRALQTSSLPKPVRPELSDIQSQTKTMAPDFKSREDSLKQLSAQREAAMAQMPNLSQEGIAALQEARQRRKDLLEQEKKYDTFRRIGALGRSMYTRGPEYDLINQAIAKREEADIAADLNHQQAVLKLKEAEQNRQLGKFDRSEELIKQGIALDTTAAKVNADNFKSLANLAGDVFGAEARMFSDAMNRRSAEAIAMADLASKARLTGDAELTRNIGLLQARLNDANSKINQELETDRKMLSVRMMGFDKAKPEEKAELMRLQQDFLAKLQQAERRYNVPSLKQQLLKLENKSLGADALRQSPSTKRFDSSGNPIQ